jgi:hypothetical protein
VLFRGNADGVAPEKRSRLGGPADFYGSPHRLWQRAKQGGTPPWVWWSLGTVSLTGVGAAVALYFAANSLLVAGVFLGIAFLVDAAILNFADLSRHAERKGEPQEG